MRTTNGIRNADVYVIYQAVPTDPPMVLRVRSGNWYCLWHTDGERIRITEGQAESLIRQTGYELRNTPWASWPSER